MNRIFHTAAACAVALATLGLAACDRNKTQTVGQEVDKALDSAKTQGQAAKQATQEAGQRMATSAGDATITAKVNAAIVADDGLKFMKIDVDTRDGKVTLTGEARDAAARDRATAVVKALDGVMDVDNQLRVTPAS